MNSHNEKLLLQIEKSKAIIESLQTEIKILKEQLINQNNKRSISFNNVVSFRVEGSISTDALNFPTETEKTPAIAQVLDIWIAINDNVEYIVLLNDYRYLTITTNKISRM